MKNLRLGLLCCLLTGGHLDAVPLLIDSAGTGSLLTDTGLEWGYRFTTTADMYVTALGFYDHLGDGLAESHSVSLYTGGLSLIASVDIAAGVQPLTSGFAFIDLGSFIHLSSYTSYILTASTGTGLDAFRINLFPNSPTFGDTLNFSGFTRNSGGQIGFGPGGSSIVGPNMIYSTNPPVVPDGGSTLFLLATALVAIAWRTRSRRSIS